MSCVTFDADLKSGAEADAPRCSDTDGPIFGLLCIFACLFPVSIVGLAVATV